MLPIETAFPLYVDLDGKPLDNGYIYFGQVDQNPVTNPVTVYWDADGTQPAAQPIRTQDGYIVRNGTPANVFYSAAYSQLVQDKRHQQIYYAADSTDYSEAAYVQESIEQFSSAIGSSLIGFIQSGVGAVLRTIQDELRETIKPVQYGATGDGSTNDTLAFTRARDRAAAVKGRVVVKAGTYRIDAGTDLTASNTVWDFEPGAVLKLVDAQATTSFITLTSPVNQRFNGARIDANRAVQNAAVFGQDNCAFLVVDANNCRFQNMEIISSPAKGFALVSSVGATTKNIGISDFVGADCNAQVLIVDGNNLLGFFDRITIDGVRIGATGHAGVALNDGASNISLSNVISDVQNTVHDGVSIRDGFDIQLSNVRGRRGRYGIGIERLNGYTGRIQLDNVVGEYNSQNGVLLLGAEDINGSVVEGRNNGTAGINIAQTGALYRCKRVSISSPKGYDDQGVPTQDYGILVQGVDTCRLGKQITYGNTTRGLSINRSVCTDVDAETRQVASGTTGSIAASGQVSVTINWPTPFEDATIDLDGAPWLEESTSSTALAVSHVIGITTNSITVQVYNRSGTTAHTATLKVAGRRAISP